VSASYHCTSGRGQRKRLSLSIVDRGLHGFELLVAREGAHFQIINGRDCRQWLIHPGEFVELDQVPRAMVPNCPGWLWGRRVPVPGEVDDLLRFRVERRELLEELPAAEFHFVLHRLVTFCTRDAIECPGLNLAAQRQEDG